MFPENVTLRFFSAVCVGVRFVCDVPHASFCGLYYKNFLKKRSAGELD